MEYSSDEIRNLVIISKPLIDPIINTIIKPKIDKLTKWIKNQSLKNDVVENYFENKFEEYLARTIEHCQNINILLFQNQQIKIKDIYYPLTLKSNKDHSTYLIDDFKLEYINPYKKILISDTAGMGKSTLSRFITLKVIENNLAIPLLIELRNLNEDHNILDEIFLQLNPIDKSFDQDLIMKFLELGHFILILDGFDEIQHKGQEIIIRNIRDFVNKASSNLFILTSRPEDGLSTFGDFQLFNILPLKEQNAFELIRKYDSVCPIKVADKLVSDIKSNFNQTKELLRNPFLVSLIYLTYTYNKDLPTNKATFYEEIYSALFKRHDLSKGGWTRQKKSKLDIQQFRILLRQLAFDTVLAGTIVYSESELLNYIQKAKEKCPGIEFNITSFLDDILTSVPLFQKDGLKIKWAHKSLQDYFSADFIAFNSKKEEIIERIYISNKSSFLNILDLFFEIDYKTFRKIIIRNILDKFILHYTSSYNSIENISDELISERRKASFDVEYIFVLIDNDSKESVFEFVQKHIPQKKISLVTQVHNYYIGVNEGFDKQIINMLVMKEIYFINDAYLKANYNDIIDNIVEVLQSEKIESIIINDNPSSIVNSEILFKNITFYMNYSSSLSKLSNVRFPVINYLEAVKELNAINEEMANDNLIDNFNDI